MDLGLANKSVFVAAASKGLGLATALEFAREGAKVVIASRNLRQLEAARQEIKEAGPVPIGRRGLREVAVNGGYSFFT
ncbi:SDR family NAD(P)-dependent oxidoreductase [Paenibacillus albidus]|uniref:SDR family NAD(P)-dependent oxidoreductase n=1 Tax=Paenibacillus albidus TaxID=2041023 RepID=UPI0035D05B5D